MVCIQHSIAHLLKISYPQDCMIKYYNKISMNEDQDQDYKSLLSRAYTLLVNFLKQVGAIEHERNVIVEKALKEAEQKKQAEIKSRIDSL